MYPRAIVIFICAIFYCKIVAAIDQPELHSSQSGGLATGTKQAMPLTPLPDTETRQYFGNFNNYPSRPGYRPPQNKKCPLCDSSVYVYCGENLLHDACCCTDPYVHDLPYQCKLADCRFLHANSCREHRLIANCCCSDDYRSLLKSFLKI